jgi:hypothetical protein
MAGAGMDNRACQYVLEQIKDGFLFERIAGEFLSAIIGYTFVPAGGIKDKGIDGLEHCFHPDGRERYVYQSSIEENYEKKIENSLEKLIENGIEFDRFHYVSNQEIKNQHQIIDNMFERYGKHVHIFDRLWFGSNVVGSDAAQKVVQSFADQYLHEYALPGKAHVVSDLIEDPRLYVFLRQQWESNKNILDLEDLLADTLIMFTLEGTDPNKHIFKSEDQIKQDIAGYLKFPVERLSETISTRLVILSRKPRKIHYHTKENAYCLPHDTRLHIQNKNLEDQALSDRFRSDLIAKLKYYLKNENTIVKDCAALVEKVFNLMFYRQGLEFANFVLHGESQDAVERRLSDIVGEVVDRSSVIPRNKEVVKRALIMTIRDVVYNGTEDQKLFLGKMANTYMMLFLLQCDPHLCSYFSAMASKLRIYVDTSLIVPALSEYFLEKRNRRHWNLLSGAKEAGVGLVVNDIILDELVAHFNMVVNHYRERYLELEDVFLDSEANIDWVDEIMVRAYLYTRLRGQIANFHSFLDKFVTPALPSAWKSELSVFLNEHFGIEYISDSTLDVKVDEDEYERLYNTLKTHKSHIEKAKNDARIILMIYAIREKDGDTASSTIFGYKTWWLSKDSITGRTVHALFRKKYPISCYIRPDFLHSYICCAPRKHQVDAAYADIFPSFLGVSLSSHLPREVTSVARKYLIEHKDTDHGRLKAKIGALSNEVRSDPHRQTSEFVNKFFVT